MRQQVNAENHLLPSPLKTLIACITLLCLAAAAQPSVIAAEVVETPYTAQKVVFDFYFDDPEKIASALFWVRSLMNPLTAAPYDYAPEDLELKVVIHGTEIVTLARQNYEKYSEAVERMRYYASLGVEFRVCAIALRDFGYIADDLPDFVTVVPSGITELAHWQLQGYALIQPQVLTKKQRNEDIR
jgi:intracellular sulfur oxidation DsrE/DsrF family protein